MFNRDNNFFILIIVFVLFLWSSSFTAIRIALNSFSPASLALLRFGVASLFLLIYGLFKGISIPALKDLPAIFISGFLGITLYHIALNYGERYVSAGLASLISSSYPIFVAILSTVFLKEHINLGKWAGIFISFIGITVITVGAGNGISLSFGALLILISAISNSLYSILQKLLLEKYTPLELTSYFIWSGTFFLLLFSPGLFKDLMAASSVSTLSAVYLGIFPGALAYLIWARVLSHGSAAKVSSIQFIIPVLALIIAFLFLHEIPTHITIIGGTLALIGVSITNFTKQTKLRLIKLLKKPVHTIKLILES